MFFEQRSFLEIKPTLYLVATPIGNLQDITLRALKVLKEVDFILVEDTRISQKLLNFYKIKKPLISFYEHNQKKCLNKILKLLETNHNLALISDAGTPLISDPGDILVQKVQEKGFHVITIPGVSAFLTAFITSCFPYPFIFLGFLPRSSQQKKNFLLKYQFCEATLLIYEVANRVLVTLQTLREIYDGDTKISLVRELTKKFETIINASIDTILQRKLIFKGEYVIVVNKQHLSSSFKNFSLRQHLIFYLKQGFTEKESFTKVAQERQIPKRDIYQEYKVSTK